MPLDPIVSLSVALAEAPRTCAFFLGSGVSRDAGVPTGQEVMRDGLRRLRQLEAASPVPTGDPELDAWLIETQREHTTYAELLAAITPDPAVRRQYLAGFFEGREPRPTHEALARMAQRGLVRVFVTTNFDRLLEHALHSQGLIITTGDFGKGARDEAARDDKPLIWLINGKQLVKLLIANDIGARRVPVELVEPTGFEVEADTASSEAPG